jgi:hypothetical protein
MAGLVPAIHVLDLGKIRGWPGLRPAMTELENEGFWTLSGRVDA